MALPAKSEGRRVEEISLIEAMRNRIVERERFFTGRSATELLFDSAAIRMERSIFERFKAIEQTMNLQKLIEQRYSDETLEQMRLMTKAIPSLQPPELPTLSLQPPALPTLSLQYLNSVAAVDSILLPLQDKEHREFWKKQAEILRKVEEALVNLPPELQEAFWDTPLADGFFDLVDVVLDPKLTDEQRAAKLATFFAGGEIESSWSQIRRALYPVAKGINPWVSLIFSSLLQCVDKEEKNIFILVLLVFAVIYHCGDPDGDENATRRNK